MSTIELIIKLKEHIYREAIESGYSSQYDEEVANAIANGTPRPKGHWIEHQYKGMPYFECSECACWILRRHLVRNSYCPNCGARMYGLQKSEEEE